MISRNECMYSEFIESLKLQISEVNIEERKIVFLCIGTDKITGDLFGPLVGDKLIRIFGMKSENVKIIGNLKNTITYRNVQECIKKIYLQYINPYIIVVDAALSSKGDIGNVLILKESICLGKSLNKEMEPIGDMGIIGVVSDNLKQEEENFKKLSEVPIDLVERLANITVDGIYNVFKK